MIDSADTVHCHDVTAVDDDVVEGPEEVQVSLVEVPNIATVVLRPNHTTITVEDDDSKDVKCLWILHTILLQFYIAAVHIGFEMAEYSVEEGRRVTVNIIQENSLEYSQDFNVILCLNSSSNATEGRYYCDAC